MPVEWMRHSDVYRELAPSNTDWIAFDGDRSVGRVYQFKAGTEKGLWFWTMTVTGPGEPVMPSSGRAQTRGEAARAVVPIATVQNLYNLANRHSEAVLDHCEANDIGFIPWFPLASGDLAKPGGPLATAAERHGVTPGAVALGWLLARSPVMLPIPGTSQVAHLEENMAGATLELDQAELDALSQAARP